MKTPPHHVGVVETLGHSLQSPLKAVCSTILNEWLVDSCLINMRHPLFERMKGAVTKGISDIGHKPTPGGTCACNWYSLKSCCGANPNG